MPAFAVAALAVLVAYPTLTAGAGPRLDAIWISPRAAALVAKYARPGDPPAVSAGYAEPSLLFALGTETRLTDGVGAAEVGAYQGGLALIDDHERPSSSPIWPSSRPTRCRWVGSTASTTPAAPRSTSRSIA